ncbi:hypothetical protein FHX76_001135 [Lysinibacter cavernae]|uniref:Uncharacterized protein n=1 Tax=Lysinibacter cavernae TaxID=1640652 RepID=A0A7X5R0M1_9MICO|nr:hypothetical protein [Lysinibacter cavernae]
MGAEAGIPSNSDGSSAPISTERSGSNASFTISLTLTAITVKYQIDGKPAEPLVTRDSDHPLGRATFLLVGTRRCGCHYTDSIQLLAFPVLGATM